MSYLMPTGSVVRYNGRLYVVLDSDHSHEGSKPILESVALIPFDASSVTVHVSRKHPFTKRTLLNKEYQETECECHEYGACETVEVPVPELSIDNIRGVANSIESFINSKLKKIFFED